MNTIKVLAIFPLMCVGAVVGFVFQAVSIGFFFGEKDVIDTAEKCADDLTKKRKATP
jgi:hypothetical protein